MRQPRGAAVGRGWAALALVVSLVGGGCSVEAPARATGRLGQAPAAPPLRAGGDGRVLAAPDLLPGDSGWSPVADLATGRTWQTATLLPSGEVLLAGGFYVEGTPRFSDATERYDPVTGSVTATGSLATARRLHTATLLPSGKVLLAGGDQLTLLASVELYDPATGTVAAAGSLATARRWHTATLLPSGKVLFVGGATMSGYLASAELYDPALGTFTPTGSLATARRGHTATLLPSGKVLIAGGQDAGGSLASAELYDPALGTFTPTGSLATPRESLTATLLPSGDVLVVGGAAATSSFPLAAELYHPASGSFTPAGALATGRSSHVATLLPSGRVMVAGGYLYDGAAHALSSVEVYDPGSNSFAPATPLLEGRYFHTATLLPNGEVLIAAGLGETFLSSVERYVPDPGSFAATGAPTLVRTLHTATLLPTGEVLVAGGWEGTFILATAELYQPDTGTFTPTGALKSARETHTATLLPSGKVLVVGGQSQGAVTYPRPAELYDPSAGTFATTGLLATGRERHTATLLASGKVLVVGGEYYQPSRHVVAGAELYDPATGTFAATGALATPRSWHTATLLYSGEVLVVGGIDLAGDPLASVELYDPASGSFTTAGAMTAARTTPTATLLPTGQVLIAGSEGPTGPPGLVELYDPERGDFQPMGSLATPRAMHTATLLPSGAVLVAGGDVTGQGAVDSGELYDPLLGTFALTGPLVVARRGHRATVLPSGQVLLVGHHQTAIPAELYDEGRGADPAWAPTLAGPLPAGQPGQELVLVGTRFTGVSEASSGGVGSSPTNQPRLLLRRVDNGALAFAPVTGWTATGGTATLPPDLSPGPYLAWVVVNGILSNAEMLVVGGWANGTACTAPQVCATGLCVDGVCCETRCLGVCQSCLGAQTGGADGTCAPLTANSDPDGECAGGLTCSGGASCRTSCDADAQCESGYYCTAAGGACAEKLTAGTECGGDTLDATGGHQCASTFCVDGFCCESACDGACVSCASSFTAKADGVCGGILANTDPEAECAGGLTCDGAGACRAVCVGDAECEAGYFCTGDTGGACAGKQAVGTSCGADPLDATGDHQCASGHCVDGRCCGTACDATCYTCDLAGHEGSCTLVPSGVPDPSATVPCATGACDGAGACKLANGAVCSSNGACGSGNCVDGVCCATACAGNCQQCNAAGHVGECRPVPDGTDPKGQCQAASGGHPDCAGVCQGGQCAFPDVGTGCGLCAACDGSGRCTAVPADDPGCGTIACGGLDTACRAYQDLTSGRCAALNTCKAPNDPDTCTAYREQTCDGGAGPADGGGAAADGGGGPADGGVPPAAPDGGGGGAKSGGCAVAPAAPARGLGLLATLALALGAACRRGRRRAPAGAGRRR